RLARSISRTCSRDVTAGPNRPNERKGAVRPCKIGLFTPLLLFEAFRPTPRRLRAFCFSARRSKGLRTAMSNGTGHIRLTSHPGSRAPPRFPIRWGAPTARERGPVIGTVTAAANRNAIGAHGGSYALYRALAVSSGALNPISRPDLTNTAPAVDIGPHPQWSDPGRIVSLD